MDLEGEKIQVLSGDELLEAQSNVWNNDILTFMKSMALKCAVQLGIPDAIHNHGSNPMALSELVSALQLNPNKTQFVYRVLVHSGLFVTQNVSQNGKQEEEGYVLTDSSRVLLNNNNPLTLVESPRVVSPWSESENRKPFVLSFDDAQGIPYWELFFGIHSGGGMEGDAKLVMNILLEKHKDVFDGIGSLVDVGGGNGDLAKATFEAFPEMECIVFDLPQVVADFKGEGNLKYVGGDMFQSIPPADALLFKWVLYDWSDEECVKILKKSKEAITNNKENKKGKVMVIEMVNKKEDDSSSSSSIETQLFFDMMTMLLMGGKERDEEQWAQIIKDAGFSGYKIFPILGSRSLIEIYP